MTNGTKGDENNMKSRKVILPLIICLPLILSTFNPVFAKSLEDYDIETLNAESMQEDYGLSLMAEASGVDETLCYKNFYCCWWSDSPRFYLC